MTSIWEILLNPDVLGGNGTGTKNTSTNSSSDCLMSYDESMLHVVGSPTKYGKEQSTLIHMEVVHMAVVHMATVLVHMAVEEAEESVLVRADGCLVVSYSSCLVDWLSLHGL